MCPELAEAAKDTWVYKNLKLKPLTIRSLTSLTRYCDLMIKCLTTGNLEVYYVKSIQEYFFKKLILSWVPSSQSSSRRYISRCNLFIQITIICQRDKDVGEAYFNKIGWKHNRDGWQSWYRVKKLCMECSNVLKATKATIFFHPKKLARDASITTYISKWLSLFTPF